MLATTVVERAVSYTKPVDDSIAQARQRLQEALHSGDLGVLAPQQPRLAQLYASASGSEKARLDHAGALRAGVARDALVDAMADPDASSDGYQTGGVAFRLLLERDLYDADTGRGLSEVRVYQKLIWGIDGDGVEKPVQNSIYDERMGPIRYETADGQPVACPVCSNTRRYDHYVTPRMGQPSNCPGHMGHMILPGAVWHPLFVAVIHSMLCSFCWHCGHLPLSDDENQALVRRMLAEAGATRHDRVKFLGAALRSTPRCRQCEQRQRCSECRAAESQCDTCAHHRPCWRPQIRTAKQASNAVKKLQDAAHDGAGSAGGGADDDEDAAAAAAARREDPAHMQRVRASRALEYSGFPCDAVLDGYVSNEQRAHYAAFARRVYGSSHDTTVLVLHGERVRALIAQMSDSFLLLFAETALETASDVREWFRALVPRVIPVAPNDARPTRVLSHKSARESGKAPLEHNDLSERYRALVRICSAMSTAIDSFAPPSQPALLYDTLARCANGSTRRMSAVETGTLYSSPRNAWFQQTPADFPHLDVYARLQYYYANVISSKRALMFLPQQTGMQKVGAAARRRIAAAAAAAGNDQSTGNAQGIAESLAGKTGLVRGHLSGKRVDFTGRSVISPDDTLAIDEIRIPYSIAAQLMVRENVNAMQVHEQVARAERIRTGQTRTRQHFLAGGRACAGCAHCEELPVTERSEMCIFTADGSQRIRYSDLGGGGGAPKQQNRPISEQAAVREAGAQIERPLRVGDYIALNRQPTLHDASFMAMRVARITGRGDSAESASVDTIGIHPLVTTPFNGDFDGDEMNLHIATSVAARAEMIELMAVPRKLTSMRNGAPLIGLKQDAATGMYELTSPDTFLTRQEACDTLMQASRGYDSPQLPQPAIRYRDRRTGRWTPLWTGLQIANFAIPAYLNYKSPPNYDLNPRTLNYGAADDGGNKQVRKLPLVCVGGTLLFGQFHGGIAGKSAGSMQRAIQLHRRYGVSQAQGEDDAVQFISRCAWLATAFLTMRGFGVGLADCTLPLAQRRRIAEITDAVEANMQRLVYDTPELLRDPGYPNRVDVIEAGAMAIERTGTKQVRAVVVGAMSRSNAFLRMEISGGKGTEMNPIQIMGCLGGQQLEGRRVVDKYAAQSEERNKQTRKQAVSSNLGTGRETTSGGGMSADLQRVDATLLHPFGTSRALDNLYQARFDYHRPRGIYPAAGDGGFIKSSFYDGLAPQEFFQHAQTGREGLTDTAVKTADTGAQMRLAMKSLESIYVAQDRTVRDATNRVICYRFGGSAGYDPRHLQTKPLEFLAFDDATLRRTTQWRDDDVVIRNASADDGRALRHERLHLDAAVANLRAALAVRRTGETTIMTPNNLASLIIDVMQELGLPAVARARWLSTSDARIVWDIVDDDDDEQQQGDEIGAVECTELVSGYLAKWRCAQPRLVCDYATECEVRLRLCSKQVVRRLRLTRMALDSILCTFEEMLYRAHVAAGESVGAASVQAIGEPATQMTLNSFHVAGKKGEMGMTGGTEQMKVLGNATQTASLKAIVVCLPLRAGGALFASAQRRLATDIIATLVPREHFAGATSAARHRNAVRQVLSGMSADQQPQLQQQQLAEQSVAVQAMRIAQAICRQSLGEQQLETQKRKHREATDGLMQVIDDLFGVDGARQPAPRTLDTLTERWSIVVNGAQLFDDAADRARIASAIVFYIKPLYHARCKESAILRESVWRALVPYFGKDVSFTVAVGGDSRSSSGSAGGDSRGGGDSGEPSGDDDRFRVAVAALDCDDDIYVRELYNFIRQQRNNIFIELLRRDSAGRLPHLLADEAKRACLHRALPRPQKLQGLVTDASDNAAELLGIKKNDVVRAQTRHLFRNFVCARVIDVTERVSLLFEPLIRDEATGEVSVQFAAGADAPSDSERHVVEGYYGMGAFAIAEVGCTRPECRAALACGDLSTGAARADVGCLNSFVLVLRLSVNWFLDNEVPLSMVQQAIERCLGPFFEVMLGNENSEPYIPLRIRVYQCRLYDAYMSLNTPTLESLDFDPMRAPRSTRAAAAATPQAGAAAAAAPLAAAAPAPTDYRSFIAYAEACRIDPAVLVLDRAKWLLLAHRFSGPRFGSAVAVDDAFQTNFTAERGLEQVRTHEIVCDSSDFHYVLGLRGIDTTRASTNAIHDIAAVLGIEAARTTLLGEYQRVLGESRAYVHRAHAALRASLQTMNGRYEPISHTGIANSAHDPCQLASHREPATMFARAALQNRVVLPVVAPSACVMLGRPLQRQGTGIVHTLLDAEALCKPDTFLFAQPEPGAVLDAYNAAADEAAQLEPLPLIPHCSPTSDFGFAPLTAQSPLRDHAGSFSPAYARGTDDDDDNDLQPPYSPVASTPHHRAAAPYSPVFGDIQPSPTTELHAYQTSPAYSPTSPGYAPDQTFTFSGAEEDDDGYLLDFGGRTTRPQLF